MADKPEEMPSQNAYRFVTVKDLEEFLRHVGGLDGYRKQEESEEDGHKAQERYLEAIRRYREAMKESNNRNNNQKPNS